MFPRTAMTRLLGRRAENVSNNSAVRRRAAGEVGAISSLTFAVSVLAGVWLLLKSSFCFLILDLLMTMERLV